MIVTVTGGSARQRELVESMAYFCKDKLMPRMKNLELSIALRELTGAYGYCLHADEREFELEIHKGLKLRRLLETVAHEMVHVKQYAKGELYESTAQGKHRWQGKWLNKDPEYWDRPWEIEAHGREVGLFVRWAEANNLGNKAWTHDR